ncbi:placenta-specific gene 8 protein-like isoform X1 [Pezoporus occidentalis]|uniref:placenta-specific gene 8 protein-like isoform X1 n=2 Tax=Pezoporus TaxID=35539 RepID=UPI002F909E31
MKQPEPTSETPVASFSDGFSFQTTNRLERPNPVLAMASQQVITVQPQCSMAPRAGEWQSGLMDCCSDCNVCLCGTFCFPCLGCQVAEDMDECCMCGPSVAMRTLYRTRYNIPGSLLGDFASTVFCPMCALCQLKRDINQRKELGIFS